MMTTPQQPPIPQPQPNTPIPPMPQAAQPVQPYAPIPPQPQQYTAPAASHANLRTKRSLTKFILLGIVTLGIYDIWQMSEIGDTLNLIATRRDGKRTMHYCLMYFLIGWLTLGIGWLVWNHKLCGRIGDEQAARQIPVTVKPSTYWLWGFLGTLIIVGPFVYWYKLLHAMNDLSANYNARGI